MAPKRPESAMVRLIKRVEKLENSPSGATIGKFSWFRSLDLSAKIAFGGLAVAILSLFVAYFAWLQPQRKAEADDALNHKIDDRIEARFQAHHFDDLASKVNKMEGQLNEISGYLKLLTARDLAQAASLSKGEFRKRLPQVQNTLQAATVAEAKVPEETTQNIQSQLLRVPDTESAFWGTASAFIDYASALRVSFASFGDYDCYNSFERYSPHPSAANTRRMVIQFDSCTLYIDDVKKFDESGFGKHFHDEVAQGVTDFFVLDLKNVHVVYRGGETIPYRSIRCENCTYSFETQSIPPPRGQALVRGALVASNGKFDISTGM